MNRFRFTLVVMENLHQFVVRRLQEVGRAQWPALAERTGVSVHTIIKIAHGYIKSPRFEKLEALGAGLDDGVPPANGQHEDAAA